jgi:hypothetical protein
MQSEQILGLNMTLTSFGFVQRVRDKSTDEFSKRHCQQRMALGFPDRTMQVGQSRKAKCQQYIATSPMN